MRNLLKVNPLVRIVLGLLVIGYITYFIIRQQAAGLYNGKLSTCKYQAKVRTVINLGVT